MDFHPHYKLKYLLLGPSGRSSFKVILLPHDCVLDKTCPLLHMPVMVLINLSGSKGQFQSSSIFKSKVSLLYNSVLHCTQYSVLLISRWFESGFAEDIPDSCMERSVRICEKKNVNSFQNYLNDIVYKVYFIFSQCKFLNQRPHEAKIFFRPWTRETTARRCRVSGAPNDNCRKKYLFGRRFEIQNFRNTVVRFLACLPLLRFSNM